MILKRIAPLPWARAVAAFAIVSALIGSTIANVAFEYSNYLLGFDQLGLEYSIDLGWSIVYGPILYGAFAFVCGLCGAWIYNGCARLFGGVEFTMRRPHDGASINEEV